MKTREEVLKFGLSFKNVYEERPFKDQNWQLVRVKESKKAFLWIYEKDGYINLNVKVNPEWRDFWRSAYDAVIAGYHQNKEHWNTIILDGTIPDKDIKRMIAEFTRQSKRFQKVMSQPMERLQRWQVMRRCQEQWEMLSTKIRTRNIFRVSEL